MAIKPLVNGRAYDYSQIVVNMLGLPVVGVSAVSYSEEQEKTNNYGTGNRPVSRGRATIQASGSIELSMNEVEAIRNSTLTGSLLGIEAFDITVTFGNIQNPVTHVLKNCEFLNDGVETAVDETDIKKSFDLVISHVVYR
jgi:hypothetical protein